MVRYFGYDEHLSSSTDRSAATRDLFGSINMMTAICAYLDLSPGGQEWQQTTLDPKPCFAVQNRIITD